VTERDQNPNTTGAVPIDDVAAVNGSIARTIDAAGFAHSSAQLRSMQAFIENASAGAAIGSRGIENASARSAIDAGCIDLLPRERRIDAGAHRTGCRGSDGSMQASSKTLPWEPQSMPASSKTLTREARSMQAYIDLLPSPDESLRRRRLLLAAQRCRLPVTGDRHPHPIIRAE
jgi:hypothetical protein